MTESKLPDVVVRDWKDLIRRARIGKMRSGFCQAFAEYATYETGRDVHPGVARLSVECEMAPATVEDLLKWLVWVGLAEVVRVGGYRRGPTEYRLIIGPHVGERITVLSPAEYERTIRALNDSRGGTKKKKQPGVVPGAVATVLTAQPLAGPGADTVDNPAQPPAAACHSPEPHRGVPISYQVLLPQPSIKSILIGPLRYHARDRASPTSTPQPKHEASPRPRSSPNSTPRRLTLSRRGATSRPCRCPSSSPAPRAVTPPSTTPTTPSSSSADPNREPHDRRTTHQRRGTTGRRTAPLHHRAAADPGRARGIAHLAERRPLRHRQQGP